MKFIIGYGSDYLVSDDDWNLWLEALSETEPQEVLEIAITLVKHLIPELRETILLNLSIFLM